MTEIEEVEVEPFVEEPPEMDWVFPWGTTFLDCEILPEIPFGARIPGPESYKSQVVLKL